MRKFLATVLLMLFISLFESDTATPNKRSPLTSAQVTPNNPGLKDFATNLRLRRDGCVTRNSDDRVQCFEAIADSLCNQVPEFDCKANRECLTLDGKYTSDQEGLVGNCVNRYKVNACVMNLGPKASEACETLNHQCSSLPGADRERCPETVFRNFCIKLPTKEKRACEETAKCFNKAVNFQAIPLWDGVYGLSLQKGLESCGIDAATRECWYDQDVRSPNCWGDNICSKEGRDLDECKTWIDRSVDTGMNLLSFFSNVGGFIAFVDIGRKVLDQRRAKGRQKQQQQQPPPSSSTPASIVNNARLGLKPLGVPKFAAPGRGGSYPRLTPLDAPPSPPLQANGFQPDLSPLGGVPSAPPLGDVLQPGLMLGRPAQFAGRLLQAGGP